MHLTTHRRFVFGFGLLLFVVIWRLHGFALRRLLILQLWLTRPDNDLLFNRWRFDDFTFVDAHAFWFCGLGFCFVGGRRGRGLDLAFDDGRCTFGLGGSGVG